MLETLVSSRIRRALFEYILTHPNEPFYLRGLAKTLDLSVSPLRRELKRLERSGMLRTFQEANALFYRVNLESPVFRELQNVSVPVPLSTPAPLAGSDPVSGPTPINQVAQASSRVWSSPLQGPALMGAVGVGLALFLIVAGLLYLTVTNQRLLSMAQKGWKPAQPNITVVAPESATSGVMHGARWRLVPGAIGGGFSSTGASSKETY